MAPGMVVPGGELETVIVDPATTTVMVCGEPKMVEAGRVVPGIVVVRVTIPASAVNGMAPPIPDAVYGVGIESVATLGPDSVP